MHRTPSPRESSSLGDWLAWAERRYARRSVALGQVSPSAHDEALYLLLHTLRLPIDSGPEVLRRTLTSREADAVSRVFRRRIDDHVPAAYLTREAFLGGHRFYVDERAIIPRSYFLEIIPRLERLRRSRAPVRRAADVGTGSGCLAVLLARQWPHAQVDAIDISAAALAVARINLRRHHVQHRVKLHRGDVFSSLPPGRRYDLIISNPPYEPSALLKTLPPEFRREPRNALDGGRDGLDVIRRLVAQSRDRLEDGGQLLIEVGGLRAAMQAHFGHLELRWLPTKDGADCVCLIEARHLRKRLPDP